MRTKAPPRFLTKKARDSHAFLYVHAIAAHMKQTSRDCQPRKKSLKKLDIKFEISRSHDHSLAIYLHDKAPVGAQCLQSLSFPFSSSILSYLKKSRRVDVYFSTSAEVTLCFEALNSKERVVVQANFPDLAFVFYGLSSSSLQLYGRIVDQSLLVDVVVKPKIIIDASDFVQYALSTVQFDKLFSFITLQMWPQDKSIHSLRLPLFSDLSETQEELIDSLSAIYTMAQMSHLDEAPSWRDLSIRQPNEIKVKLLDYQLDAVRWMVFREKNVIPVVDTTWIHPYFVRMANNLYFSAITGHFSTVLPNVPSCSCLGGILADEMGLGKTLEVVSLILHRPCPSDVATIPLYDLKSASNLDGVFAFNSTSESVADAEEMDIDKTLPMIEENIFCVCGGMHYDNVTPIVCSVCDSGYFQHKECVQFNRIIESSNGGSLRLKYICPLCWNNLRVHSKATLIVSPDHIWRQWQDEIQNHVDLTNLKVLIYEGISSPLIRLSATSTYHHKVFKTPSETGSESSFEPNFVQPSELASADIVLTTYTVLQREVGWAAVSTEQRVGEGHRPSLRTVQRYLTPPSPLACVIWWRICLDEAQMAESVTSKTAMMLKQVDAMHRWCVTGTPAEKNLNDFFGLLSYLRVEPFTNRHYWKALLHQPFIEALRSSPERSSSSISSTLLVAMLSRLLWRNTKALVGSQLHLPPVQQSVHWVDFTSVERYIHNRVLSDCKEELQKLLSEESQFNLDSPLAALSSEQHRRLVSMVTRARQACTHASLVVLNGASATVRTAGGRGGGRISGYRDPTLLASRNAKYQGTGCASMAEVIRRVVDEVRLECEAFHRTWVSHQNGAAALYILQQKYRQAAACYREVLRSSVELESCYGVLADRTQRLHSVTNLHWLIQVHGVALEDVPLTPEQEKRLKEVSEVDSGEMPTWDQLDPRVDRDLLQKAKLLRMEYLKSNSHLLSKAHEKLFPVASRLKSLLLNPPNFPTELFDDHVNPWVIWLHKSLDCLAESEIFDQLPFMVELGLQGRAQFRTTLLQPRSGTGFKSVLLAEVQSALSARQRLLEAMAPLNKTWTDFNVTGEPDRSVLEKYYGCCCDRDIATEKPKAKPRKRARAKCDYCLASEAIKNYRKILNQEVSTTSARAQRRASLEEIIDDSESDDDPFLLSGDVTAIALKNPLTVALQTVGTHICRLSGDGSWIKCMAKNLDTLIQLLFRELLYLGKVQMLTKEWWNVHDETEQMVLRLQTTSPTDIAFIEPDRVEIQLQHQNASALWERDKLHRHLKHLVFLKNALQEHHTAANTLECPTCRQLQSPTCPTFVLLAGCWHSLCLPCHETIQSFAVPSQRRCPLCRKPFEDPGSSATKRKPLTLLHYDGGGKSLGTSDEEKGVKEGKLRPIPIKGDHSSKIQEVIRCLKRLKLEDATAKAVVFSSWTSVLSTIGRALEQNGIASTCQFRARDDGLSPFRSSDSRVWVLLLPLQLGANGLNLTEANHLLLVDPVLSHGREVQAIARLHRIGQTRLCTVHRFLVRNSIEAALHGVSSSITSKLNNFSDCIRRGTAEDRAEILQMSGAQLLEILNSDMFAQSY